MSQVDNPTMTFGTGGRSPDDCASCWPASGRRSAGTCVNCGAKVCAVCGGHESTRKNCSTCGGDGHAKAVVQL